jgi:hypothetical protein
MTSTLARLQTGHGAAPARDFARPGEQTMLVDRYRAQLPDRPGRSPASAIGRASPIHELVRLFGGVSPPLGHA